MTTATTTDTLARLRELAQKATPSPWAIVADVYKVRHPRDVEGFDDVCWTAESDDAELIAACDPQTILRLCDVIAAADKMRHMGSMHGTFNTIDLDAYDAARKALNER